MTKKVDVLIIGGGVAGFSAALYTAREGFNTVVLEGSEGSAISLTSSIENFPGFDTAHGAELADKVMEQATSFGAVGVYGNAVSLDTSPLTHVNVTDDSGNIYEARAVLIATGAVAKLIGLDKEKEFYGKGVSTCATCDGFFFAEKKVVVVGGGDTAVEDSLFLNKTFNTEVDLLVRGDKFRTNSPDARKLLELSQIEGSNVRIHFGLEAAELIVKDGENFAGIITKTGETFNADGLFVAVGRIPNTAFLKGSTVQLDELGYVLATPTNKASGEGNERIWAVGDVVDSRYAQAITASGRAVESAIDMRIMLNSED